jgi:HD-GYP domain-containing protein (c-di-GMP phosphodiesterase class II)
VPSRRRHAQGYLGSGDGPPERSTVRIVLIYAVFAGVWIVLSDAVLRESTVDPNLLTLFAVLKGLLFVAVTSLILLVLIRGYFTRISEVVRELKVSRDQIEQSLQSTVEILGKVTEIRDPYTAGHQRRVRELAVAIAEKMGMPEAEIADIGTAAAVHDMGKISVPAEILTKPGSLSPIEFELIRAHSQGGFDLLSEARMPRNIAELVRQHHERCDGSGYPRGLKSAEILDGAKVLMVADVVEAMSSYRPYRPALGPDAALAEIEQGEGTLYDSAVCRALIALVAEGHDLFGAA